MKKILLVTGASSEVGIVLVKRIYAEYDTIYLQYRTMNDQLKALHEDIGDKVNVILVQADFSDLQGVDHILQMFEEHEQMPNHIVHLPAPKAYNKQFHKDKWKHFEQGWEISLHSIAHILQACIPTMSKQNYGRIVFMLSSCTVEHPPKYQTSYVTVKYALLGLMKSLSVEYAEKGITVNGVSPDMMETKFISELPELIVEQNAANSPLRRNVYIDEVIPIIEYMLSDAGAAMTGQNIGITGGL